MYIYSSLIYLINKLFIIIHFVVIDCLFIISNIHLFIDILTDLSLFNDYLFIVYL